MSSFFLIQRSGWRQGVHWVQKHRGVSSVLDQKSLFSSSCLLHWQQSKANVSIHSVILRCVILDAISGMTLARHTMWQGSGSLLSNLVLSVFLSGSVKYFSFRCISEILYLLCYRNARRDIDSQWLLQQRGGWRQVSLPSDLSVLAMLIADADCLSVLAILIADNWLLRWRSHWHQS